jgi:hypothetical protein
MSGTEQVPTKKFWCEGRLDPKSGELCQLFFTRQFNLDRHIRNRHEDITNDGFVQYLPGKEGVLRKERFKGSEIATMGALRGEDDVVRTNANANASALAVASGRPAIHVTSSASWIGEQGNLPFTSVIPNTTSTSVISANTTASCESLLSSSSTDLSDSNLDDSQHTSRIATPNGPNNPTNSPRLPSSPLDAPAGPVGNSSLLTLTFEVPNGVPLQSAGTINAHLTLSPPSAANKTSPAPNEVPVASWEERRDRRDKRLHDSINKYALPSYRVKRSRKWPLQQSGISWMTQAGKHCFDGHLTSLLAQWGVTREKETHHGSCVLCPADWAALGPSRLATLFNFETCPLEGADGVVYTSKSQHQVLV